MGNERTLSTTAVEMEGVLKMEIERENRTKGTSGGERCRKFDGNF
jgi:hypothetical protein